MRLVSNVLVLFLASLLFVACGDDDKNKNDEGNGNGNGDDNGLILKFDGLADFEVDDSPADFKVGVYKGSVADNTSTLEITVEIVCGDNKASKTVAAEKGVAEFKIDDFSKAKFTDVAKDASCKATATAEGATKGEKSITATDDPDTGTGPNLVATGLITGSGKVKLMNKESETCGAHLVKWTASSGSHTVVTQAVGGSGLDLPNVYLSGEDANTKCKVTVAGTEVTIAAANYPATSLGVNKKATSAAATLTFTGAANKAFDWFLEATDNSVTLGKTSGSVASSADAEETVTGVTSMTADHGNVNIWIKHTGGIEKL